MSMMDYYVVHTAKVDNVITTKVYGDGDSASASEEAQIIINKIWSYPEIQKDLYMNCLELGSYAIYNIDELIGDSLGIDKSMVWVNIMTGVHKDAFIRGFIGCWEYDKVSTAFKEIFLTYGLFAVCIDGILYVWCPFDNYGLIMRNNERLVSAILGTKPSPNPLYKRLVPNVSNINKIGDIVKIVFQM